MTIKIQIPEKKIAHNAIMNLLYSPLTLVPEYPEDQKHIIVGILKQIFHKAYTRIERASICYHLQSSDPKFGSFIKSEYLDVQDRIILERLTEAIKVSAKVSDGEKS